MQQNSMEIKEFDIPVPWGHVAVKAWGRIENEPVLVSHGIQDNAGSHDLLIPLLPTCFYYICIDLPGHGKSSPFPPHLPVHSINYVYVYKIILDELKRDKYVILGHSYGGQIGLMFSQLFPEYVTKLIIIDTFFFICFPPSLIRRLTDCYDKLEEFSDVKKQPTYTLDEITEKVAVNRLFSSLTIEAARIILKRCLVKVGENEYKITTDPRLKHYNGPVVTMTYLSDSLNYYPLKCPTLFIFARESMSTHRSYYQMDVIAEIKKHKNVKIELVDGQHHVHLTNPERVCDLIGDFMINKKSKAWGDRGGAPVLVAHGVQDNAAFMDFLIPELPRGNFWYVCLDLPGHGRSAHFPPHVPLSLIDYVYVYKLITKKMNWSKCTIIGHSFGGQIGLLFAHLYPNIVQRLIVIDILYFVPMPVNHLDQLRLKFEKQCDLNKSKTAPQYTREEILFKMGEKRIAGRIPRNVSEILIERCIEKVADDKYIFTTDPRLGYPIRAMWDSDFIKKLTKFHPFQCPVLFVISELSGLPYIYPRDFITDVMEHLKKEKMVKFETVPGTHDCHLHHPKEVGKVIGDFLLNVNSKY